MFQSESQVQAALVGRKVCYVSSDNSEINFLDIKHGKSSETNIEQRSIKLADYGITGDFRITACQPE